MRRYCAARDSWLEGGLDIRSGIAALRSGVVSCSTGAETLAKSSPIAKLSWAQDVERIQLRRMNANTHGWCKPIRLLVLLQNTDAFCGTPNWRMFLSFLWHSLRFRFQLGSCVFYRRVSCPSSQFR